MHLGLTATMLCLSPHLLPLSVPPASPFVGGASCRNASQQQNVWLHQGCGAKDKGFSSALNGAYSPFITGVSKPRRQMRAAAGWFLGLGGKKDATLPEIVKVGDPVLHEPTRDVDPGEIGTERIDKIIANMIRVMRQAPGVGLAAPQIGVPLKVITVVRPYFMNLLPMKVLTACVRVDISSLIQTGKITCFAGPLFCR